MEKPQVVIFRSNPIAPDPRVEKIAYALSKSYAVHVVGWDRIGARKNREESPYFSLELYSKPSSYGTGIKNLFHLLGWQIYLFFWVLRFGRSYQVIHACDFDTVLPALLGKFLFGSKIVYDIFDFYADHIRNTPQWLKRIIRWIDFKAIRYADAIILVTEAQLSQIKGSQPAKLIIIYNTPVDSPSLIEPLAQRERGRGEGSFCVAHSVRAPSLTEIQHDPSINLRVAYIGILQLERGLLEMIEVMRKHPDWHFDLAGFGGDEQAIVKPALGLPNITWHGRIPYDQTIALSRSADVLFSTCDPVVPNYRHASANKVFEAMMLGKPIVVARGTHMDLMVEKYQCGLVVTYGDVDELEATLGRLANDSGLRSGLGHNARQAYEAHYSWGEMEKRFEGLYESLLAKK